MKLLQSRELSDVERLAVVLRLQEKRVAQAWRPQSKDHNPVMLLLLPDCQKIPGGTRFYILVCFGAVICPHM